MIVRAPEAIETFTLDAAGEAALLAAVAEGDRGDVVSAEEFFRQLRRNSEALSTSARGPVV